MPLQENDYPVTPEDTKPKNDSFEEVSTEEVFEIPVVNLNEEADRWYYTEEELDGMFGSKKSTLDGAEKEDSEKTKTEISNSSDNTPEETSSPAEKKNIFSRAKEWVGEKLGGIREAIANAIDKVKEKIPTLGKPGGFLDRLETRVLGGKEAYNSIYSQVSKEDINKTVFDKENLPSTIQKERDAALKGIGINNGEQVLVQNEDFSKRYIANAYTMNVDDIAGTSANFTVKSADELSSLKIPGKESSHGVKEMDNISANNAAFKAMINKFKIDIADGKDIGQVLKGKPFTNKETGAVERKGSFDIDNENIMKVKCTELQDGTFNLSVYNYSNKSLIEVKGAESFEDAVAKMDELIKASELATEKINSALAEKEGQELTDDTPQVSVNIECLDAKDIIETKSGRLYEIQSAVDLENGERIFSCRSLVQNAETGLVNYTNRSSETVEISSNDIKNLHKDISFEPVAPTLSTDEFEKASGVDDKKSETETLTGDNKEGDDKVATGDGENEPAQTPKKEVPVWNVGDVAKNYKDEKFVVIATSETPGSELPKSRILLAPITECHDGSVVIHDDKAVVKGITQYIEHDNESKTSFTFDRADEAVPDVTILTDKNGNQWLYHGQNEYSFNVSPAEYSDGKCIVDVTQAQNINKGFFNDMTIDHAIAITYVTAERTNESIESEVNKDDPQNEESTDSLAAFSAPASENNASAPEQTQMSSFEAPSSADDVLPDEKIEVGDIISKSGHSYIVTYYDTKQDTYHIKSASYDEANNSWVSTAPKADKVQGEKIDDYSIEQKHSTPEFKKGDSVITYDGKQGVYDKPCCIKINGKSIRYASDSLFQPYNPTPEKSEDENNSEKSDENKESKLMADKKDVLSFGVDGKEDAPSLENTANPGFDDEELTGDELGNKEIGVSAVIDDF